MKTRVLLAICLLAVLFQSCQRAMSPYEAANNPRGKRCGVIR